MGEAGSASRLQRVHNTGFFYRVYKHCVFLHQDTMGYSLLTGVPQLSLEQTTNVFAPTSQVTAFTCGFLHVLVLQRTASALLHSPSTNSRGDMATWIKSSTFLMMVSQVFPWRRAG